MKHLRPGVPLETLVRLLNQALGQAVSAEATASASGWDPERPDQLRNDLASYQESRQSALTAETQLARERHAAEAASKLSSLQASVAQSRSDVASLRASQTLYSKAKMILDSNPDIGDNAIRQDVGRKIQELQSRVSPLHNAVTHVDGTLTRERQQRQAASSFAKQKVNPVMIRDPGRVYVDRWGRVYQIPPGSYAR
jgi:aminopeptidase N